MDESAQVDVLMPQWRCEQCEATWLMTEEDTRVERCPHCDSTDVYFDRRFGVDVQPAVFALESTMPMWQCWSCNSQWIMTDGGLSGPVEHCPSCGYHAIEIVDHFAVDTFPVAYLQSERPTDKAGR